MESGENRHNFVPREFIDNSGLDNDLTDKLKINIS